MGFYALTGLINGIVASAIGIFVYTKDKKALTNRTLALFCLAVSIWSYSYFLWQISKDEGSALFWSKALMAGAVFITIFYFHFTLGFLQKIKEYKKVLIFGYIFFFISFLANFTPFFVKDVVPKLNFPYWPNPGILYHPFLLAWIFYAILPIYLLIKEWSITSGDFKNQIKYILIGTIVGYSGGITNYLLWYNISVPPFGNWTTTFYLIVVAYAFLKYHLLGIKVILTEFLVGIVGIILLIDLLTSKGLLTIALKAGILIAFGYLGYLLIKSVYLEIQRREEIEKIDKAKSDFISIASHQLRTPLTAIKGYISMILEGTYGQLTEKQSKPLGNVYQSNERLIKLVNDLLNLSRLDAGKIEFSPTLTSLEEMVFGIVEELKINAEKKGLYIKTIKPSGPLPKIMVDQDKLRQVILNIVDNAIKYTKEGGITFELKKLNGQEEVRISDTGEGMDEKELNSLFQMFSRATAGTQLHAEGAGLGLYVARQFIEMHGGKIWAESPGKGKGSTLIIQLPIKLSPKLLKEKTRTITKAADNIF